MAAPTDACTRCAGTGWVTVADGTDLAGTVVGTRQERCLACAVPEPAPVLPTAQQIDPHADLVVDLAMKYVPLRPVARREAIREQMQEAVDVLVDVCRGVIPPAGATAAPAPRTTYWAAYVGTSMGQSITLHTSERDALEEIADYLWGQQPDDEKEEHEQQAIEEQSDEDLEAAIEDHCLSGADDWHVNEVELP